jgi:ribosomal protein S18 acetylase RimI-like enzyme
MAAARDLAAETGAAYLVVGTAADNLAAQGFYAGLGMVPVETGGPRFRFDIEPRPESGKGGC